jgi:lysine-N-methylase
MMGVASLDIILNPQSPMSLKLELPTLQSWSCHNCSGCCRQHAIEVTEEERQRILGQNWTEADGVMGPVVVPMGGMLRRGHRLAHQADGACVFLDEKGLCRIHAKFGEAAKPLACRIYPFAFHPSGKSVTVSLRFSCPSVVANKGKPVGERRGELLNLAKAVVPEQLVEPLPPRISAKESVDWKDFARFIAALDAGFADTGTPFLLKLLRTLAWVDLVGEARFGALKGTRIGEFLDLIVQCARTDVAGLPAELGSPSKLNAMQFRLLVGQYARQDTFAADRSLRGRLRMLRASWSFARGKRTVPAMQEAFREVPFAAVERVTGTLSAEAEEIFTRYFRVKIQGLHFCGPAYYDVPLVEGFQSLALVLPAVMWLARWLAASGGRAEFTTDDVAQALAIADHHHGYSPLFGSRAFRRRVRLLAAAGDIAKLCLRYAVHSL